MNGRRIFINHGKDFFQIFRFQQKDDGSIIAWWPDFSNTNWLGLVNTKDGLKVISVKSEGDGKLNIHGCGIATFRPHNDPKNHGMIIKGNLLLDKEKKTAGLRHLFSAFIRKPIYTPKSPVFNRESDYPMQSKEELAPCVITFFAIPQTQKNLTVNFQFSLSVDDMNRVPEDMLGWHQFSLRYHNIFWFAYRTKHMDDWPKNTQVSYDDGYKVPVFIGTAKEHLRLEYRMPKYLLEDDQLTIKCNIDNS